MNELQLVNKQKPYLDSREVAEMVNIRHADLLEKIDGYMVHLLNGNFRSVDFFIKDEYQDSTGRTLPCYKITKQGCEMIANKLTGKKGVLFTAAYVTRFNEMEQQQPALPQMTQAQIVAFIAQQAADQEQKILQLAATAEKQGKQIETIKETIVQRKDNWREWVNETLNKIAHERGDLYFETKGESYDILEERAGCDLAIRVKNMKARLKDSGACKTVIKRANKLDVIEADSRLKEIYTAIVKEMLIQYVA